MKLIVGLGNPEKRYEGTRHNAGFMVADCLARRHAPSERVKARFRGDTLEAPIASTRCLLLKPMAYMNRSGPAVQEAASFYKIDLSSDLLVITDDLALPVGAIRLRARGGSGGHNGLADISRALGSDDYPRLRVGIGAKPSFMDQADYVLSRFTELERDAIERAVNRAADATETFVREGVEAAMNTFNERMSPPSSDDQSKSGDQRKSARPEAVNEAEKPSNQSRDVDPGWLGGPSAQAPGGQLPTGPERDTES